MGQTLSGFLDSPPESFSKDDLEFLHPVPEHVDIECPICLQVMISDPHIVSCCGNHFCGYCIRRSRARDNSCPLCKTQGYESMADKGLERRINSLCVKCVMASAGCPWEGELRCLFQHLAKQKREGDCKFTVVQCRNSCAVNDTRANLIAHEILECPRRAYQCPYCQSYNSTYQDVIENHMTICNMFPVSCPNGCDSTRTLPRGELDIHMKKDCPLQRISCEYSWAGCNKKLQRKNIHEHCRQSASQHLSLVSQSTQSLKTKNQDLAKEVTELRAENSRVSGQVRRQARDIQSLKSEVSELKKQNHEMRAIKRDIQLLQQRLGFNSSSSY